MILLDLDKIRKIMTKQIKFKLEVGCLYSSLFTGTENIILSEKVNV